MQSTTPFLEHLENNHGESILWPKWGYGVKSNEQPSIDDLEKKRWTSHTPSPSGSVTWARSMQKIIGIHDFWDAFKLPKVEGHDAVAGKLGLVRDFPDGQCARPQHQPRISPASAIFWTDPSSPINRAFALIKGTVDDSHATTLTLVKAMPGDRHITDPTRIDRVAAWLDDQQPLDASVNNVDSVIEALSPPRTRSRGSSTSSTEIVTERIRVLSTTASTRLGEVDVTPQGRTRAELLMRSHQSQGSSRHSSPISLRRSSPQGRSTSSSSSRIGEDSPSSTISTTTRLHQVARILKRRRSNNPAPSSDSESQGEGDQEGRISNNLRRRPRRRRLELTPSTSSGPSADTSAAERRSSPLTTQSESAQHNDDTDRELVILDSDPSIASEPCEQCDPETIYNHGEQSACVEQLVLPVCVVPVRDHENEPLDALQARDEDSDVVEVARVYPNMDEQTLMDLVRKYFRSGRAEREYRDMMLALRSDRNTRKDRDRKREERAAARNAQAAPYPALRAGRPGRARNTVRGGILAAAAAAAGIGNEQELGPLGNNQAAEREVARHHHLGQTGFVLPPTPPRTPAPEAPPQEPPTFPRPPSAASVSVPASPSLFEILETYNVPSTSNGAPAATFIISQVRPQLTELGAIYYEELRTAPINPASAPAIADTEAKPHDLSTAPTAADSLHQIGTIATRLVSPPPPTPSPVPGTLEDHRRRIDAEIERQG
ncbi:hypothetical protein QAD02_023722 [Eretmocerus hayati]|uniref:Uncharacterized protein n=1 Tax=Eretmocerus hayati TaxID=131215 RepID=A0ACC2Q014_9HYME|nr:hypothetical protein QAD02_023722 [Eretmocerus hayati]